MAPVIRIGSTSWTTREPTALRRKSYTANYPLECRPRSGAGHTTPSLVVPDYPTHVQSNSCHTNPRCAQLSRRSLAALPEHSDHHCPERPVLLAVDQQLGEGAALRVAPEPPIRSARSRSGSMRTWSSSARVRGRARRGVPEAGVLTRRVSLPGRYAVYSVAASTYRVGSASSPSGKRLDECGAKCLGRSPPSSRARGQRVRPGARRDAVVALGADPADRTLGREFAAEMGLTSPDDGVRPRYTQRHYQRKRSSVVPNRRALEVS
jgi:hypothetical protein